LLQGALASGAQATGQGADRDWLVLDDAAPQFAGAQPADAVDRWIFSGNRNLVRDVHVAGQRVVADGRHRDRDAIATRYAAAMRHLLA
jgi:formimidoylglutamate deiminase